ncbi:MAG: TspO/MBR family protein [bacterium]|nr:TspO/MBR family protein [bacterium]
MASYARTLAGTALATGATAGLGSLATDPDSFWYRFLDTPDWQPPRWAFPVAWTALYGAIAHSSASALSTLREEGDDEEAEHLKRGLGVNLALNAGWSYLFFQSKNPPLAAVGAAALAVSSASLTRRVWRARRSAGIVMAPYAAWTAFATALSTSIAARNS